MNLDELRAGQHNDRVLPADIALELFLHMTAAENAQLDRAAHASSDEVRAIGRAA